MTDSGSSLSAVASPSRGLLILDNNMIPSLNTNADSSSTPIRVPMSAALEQIAHLLVTPENSPWELNEMDSERRAALHNAIFTHGWVTSGRDADDFIAQSRPWLELNPQAAQDGFHPTVLAFLQVARALPLNRQVNFFYNAWD